MVGVEVTLLGIDSVSALSSCSIVIDFVSVIELTGIQHLGSIDGVCHIDALDGSLFIFVGFLPGYGLAPVEMWSDGIALLVLFYLVSLIATIGRIGQTFANDTVAHPIDKLSVLGIAHLLFVHPEAIHTDIPHGKFRTPQGIIFLYAHP